MDEASFQEILKEIDQVIEQDFAGKVGLTMGFGLAGEFFKRGLLEYWRDDTLWPIEGRTYRGCWIYPDPMFDEYEYRIGR